MLRKGIVILALCLLPAVCQAQARGPFELTLGGSGANGSRFDGFTGAINGSIGYFFNDSLELSARQSLDYTDVGVGKSINGSTRVALDLHFPLGDQGQFLPFVGVNVGYVYGDNVNDTWEGAPEAGLKWFVNNTTFVFISVEYQIFFDRHSSTGQNFSDGQFVYGLGIGFRF
jgi:outer membrane protein with beta-barrel domain